jgi:IS5 family transposase
MFGGAFAASRLRIHVRSFVFDENRTLLKSHPQICAIGADPGQIEKVFGTWKRDYGLRRMQWRGLAKADVQIRLTAIAYNMKCSLKIITVAT